MTGLVGHKWGLGRPRGHREGVWKGLQGRLGTRIWAQHGPNLSQVGANLGQHGANLSQLGVQIGSNRPSCSNHEGILRPLGAYTTSDAKNDPKMIEICSKKMTKIDAFKAPEKPKYIGKRMSGSKSRKNDHEAKTYRFGSHPGAILASSWGAWEAFRGHFGRLGANLSQHKAILSHLGANLRPPGANIAPT